VAIGFNQSYRNQSLGLPWFNLPQASHFQVPLQDARLQIVFPTKIAYPRSTAFVFDYEPFDFFPASAPPALNFVVFAHTSTRPKKPRVD
jgi:hypothetical protein